PPGHVVLLDGGVGRESAVIWTRYWRGLLSPAYVLVLELTNDAEVILPCIEAGASGYTIQGASVAEVAKTIKEVKEGIAHCSPRITAEIFARLAALKAASTQILRLDIPLTPRELE